MKPFEFYSHVLRLLLAFFLVIQKSVTTATLIKAAKDWNGLLEHIIDHEWLNTCIVYLLWLMRSISVKKWFKSEPFHLQRWVPVGTNESFKEWCITGGGVEWLLKSLLIFLKQAITLPKDFLMFLITYFFPLKINSSAKTISISADIDFPCLRRYIFRHCNLFIKKKKVGIQASHA